MDEDEHSEGEEDMQFEEEYSDNSHTSDSHEDEMEWQHRPQPPQRSRLDATSSIMLQTIQQRTLAPQVEMIKRCINMHNDMQLLAQLHQTNDFLLQFTETFAEVAPNQDDNDFCGLGPILTQLLVEEWGGPELMVPAVRIIKVLSENSRLAMRQMVEGHILEAFLAHLSAIELIDIAEAILDSIGSFAIHYSRRCLQVGLLRASLMHLDFFPRATQLSALKAAVVISKAINSVEDYTNFVKPMNAELTFLLKNSVSDPTKLGEVLRLYQNLVIHAKVGESTIDEDENRIVLYGLCHELKDPVLWTMVFKLLAQASLNLEAQVTDLLELGVAQLEAQCSDVKRITDRTENVIEEIFKVLVGIFLNPNMLDLIPLPADRQDGNVTVTFCISKRMEIPLLSLKAVHEIPLPICTLLLHIIDRVLSEFSCSAETEALCVLLILSISLSKGSLTDFELTEFILEDLCYILTSRRSSTLSILSLCTLAAIFAKVPLARKPLAMTILSNTETRPWGPIEIIDKATALRALHVAISELDFDMVINETATVERVAAMAEMALIKACKKINATAGETITTWEGYTRQIEEFCAAQDPSQIEELLKSLGRVQRYITRNDDEHVLVQIPGRRRDKHPFSSLLQLAAFQIKISVTAEIEGRHILENRTIVTEPLISPSIILDLLVAGNSENFESGDISIDLNQPVLPFRQSVDWTRHKCTVKYGNQTLRVDPDRPVLVYALAGLKNVDDISSSLRPLKTSVLRIHVEPIHGNDYEEETGAVASPTTLKCDLQACLQALHLASQSFAHDLAVQESLVSGYLSGQLSRQLCQTFLVAGNFIPLPWRQLLQQYPFIIDYETRVDYLVATTFGISRYLDVLTIKRPINLVAGAVSAQS